MSESGQCNHFVIRKKRYCKMTVKSGETFCGEHQPPRENKDDSGVADGKIRVTCPLDPKHTCYAHALRKHLKICNARPHPPLPYIQKGTNSGREGNEEDLQSHKLLSTFATDEIKNVVDKVNKIYDELLTDKITNNLLTHKAVEEEISKPENGDKSKKHLKQASAILGLLSHYGLEKEKTCYIEFGAGRGQLSYWLAQTATDSSFVLIERSSPKHKRDNKLDKTEDKVKRIRADIADLVLDKLETVSKVENLVGVTKHLCGDATDLALRCLTNVSDLSKIAGCIMTFCCHHRCRWTPYAGKDFFKSVGLNTNDFDMMCGMSSWATCGTGFSREKNKTKATNENVKLQNDRDAEIGLDRLEKEEVGRRCKCLLNWGRLRFLDGLGFKCHLHYYVDREVSLENVCLVAYRSEIN